MTLILAAVCQDGIAICSDRRCTVKTAHGSIHRDDLQKLYRFNKVRVLAYNHGINRINGRMWDCCLQDFEVGHVQSQMSFHELVDTFKTFIEGPAAEELAANPFDDGVGFVFCATFAGEPVVRELFWKGDMSLEDKPHRGLIRTGSGACYLNDQLVCRPELNTVKYWARRPVEDGLTELTALFARGSEERRKEGGEEFSDTYDTDILRSQPEDNGDEDDGDSQRL